MAGIDINLLKAAGAAFIIGKRVGRTTNGISYEAEMHFCGKFYNTQIINYWFGGGKVLRAIDSNNNNSLLEIESTIEKTLPKLYPDFPKQFFMRNILIILFNIFKVVAIIGIAYYIFNIRQQTLPVAIIKIICNIIAMVVSQYGILKTYARKLM